MIGDYTYHNNQPQLMLATLTPEKKILTLKEAGVLVSPSPITIGEQKIVFCPKFYGLTVCKRFPDTNPSLLEIGSRWLETFGMVRRARSLEAVEAIGEGFIFLYGAEFIFEHIAIGCAQRGISGFAQGRQLIHPLPNINHVAFAPIRFVNTKGNNPMFVNTRTGDRVRRADVLFMDIKLNGERTAYTCNARVIENWKP